MSNIIYKYLPSERITYLENELLRFTQPGDLNDPFECLPVYPTVEETIEIINKVSKMEIDSLKKMKLSKSERIDYKNKLIRKYKTIITDIKKDSPKNLRKDFYKDSNININSKLGIFSLSRRWNSTLMWSHYTNSHKGFCVGFDRTADFFMRDSKSIDPNYIFQPVIYDENRIKIPIERGVKINPNVLLTKSLDWKYEEEERVLASLDKSDKRIKNEPFDIFLFRVPHKIIKEIVTGANISKNDYEKINQFCIENNIELYESKISDTKFNMNRKKRK
ncbi:hypothetical protein LPB03_13550 [Polaribacter vadi]|uniref:DUF2971 domain-containing protein n=1 Tax=Polaribacter vadi TaxID=1774273 RepID=A0A1B8U1R8_9FLAO|nr:DUF2971 domain-containing protein [Polaribacter vadi]AOW18416.1 hypothetical protein LPB03_13550 [Polaribacter vadi]OBY65816.1 hypothetical protein LPB3_02910 [Polaribacter vadi]